MDREAAEKNMRERLEGAERYFDQAENFPTERRQAEAEMAEYRKNLLDLERGQGKLFRREQTVRHEFGPYREYQGPELEYPDDLPPRTPTENSPDESNMTTQDLTNWSCVLPLIGGSIIGCGLVSLGLLEFLQNSPEAVNYLNRLLASLK